MWGIARRIGFVWWEELVLRLPPIIKPVHPLQVRSQLIININISAQR
jgi:hypothetical protein